MLTTKSKLLEVDLIRAIAILAVIIIHGTSFATVELQTGSLSQILFLVVNKLANFAVPVFIVASGIVLFYRYTGEWSRAAWIPFYMKRLKFIVIPYVIWSIFYYIFNQMISKHYHFSIDLSELAANLLWGRAGYHLYFVIIIVQFYLLFPILMALAEKFRLFGQLLFLFGAIIQIVYYAYTYNSGPDNLLVAHRASICLTYFGLFCAGGSIGLHYARFSAWLRSSSRWVIPLTMLIGAAFMMLYLLAQRNAHFPSMWYDVLFHCYGLLAGVSLIYAGGWLLRKLPQISAWLSTVGAISFGIYFMHPAVLSVLKVKLHMHGGISLYIMLTLVMIILTFAVPYFVVRLLRRFQHAWILFGK